MPLSGGIKEQLGIASKSPLLETSTTSTTSSQFLGRLFKEGRISSKEVLEGSKAFGLPDATTDDWATLSLDNPQNAQRGLKRKLAKNATHVPQLYVANAPLWDKTTNQSYTGKLYFLLPFEVLDAVIPPGSIADVCQYNGELEAEFEAWSSKANITSASSTEFIAIDLWGDSAPFNTRDSLELALWSIRSRNDTNLGRRYWLTSFSKESQCKCGCKGRHTYEVVFDILKWNFEVQLSGRRPTHRHDGTPFAESNLTGDQSRAMNATKYPSLRAKSWLSRVRGDWCWYKQILGLTGWSGETTVLACCWRCMANKTDVPFDDFGLDALWRQTKISHAYFLAKTFVTNGYLPGMATNQ